jgi:uncharacterized protein (DUF885 family)
MKMNLQLLKLQNRFLEDYCSFHPTTATSLGLPKYNGAFSDFSETSVQGYLKGLSGLQKELRMFRAGASLDPDDSVDKELLLAKIALEENELTHFPSHRRDPSAYASEVLYGLWFLFVRPFSKEEKIEGLLSRLLRVRELFSQAEKLLFNPPKVWLKIGLSEAEGLFHFLKSCQREDQWIPRGLRPGFNKAYQGAMEAAQGYKKFLSSHLSKTAKGRFSVGKDNFNFLLKNYHGFSDGASEILKRGEAVFIETQEALQESASKLRKGTAWEKLIDEIKVDHPSQKNLISTYQGAVRKTVRFIRGQSLVAIPAGERLRVIPTPEFARSTIPYAAYIDPPLFAKDRTGHFFVTPVSGKASRAKEYLKEHSHASLLITALHEGYPGHHLQFVYQANLKRPIRKIFNCSSYYEGWALYCEEMMGEEGFYDERAKLLQLKDKLWRACRVIVDVKMHTQGMSDEAAVKFLAKNARMSPAAARADVNWYTQRPTVPLSYLTGMLKIKALREEAKRKWGRNYSLKKFHEWFLGFGAIPISLTKKLLR